MRFAMIQFLVRILVNKESAVNSRPLKELFVDNIFIDIDGLGALEKKALGHPQREIHDRDGVAGVAVERVVETGLPGSNSC
jgi:hypothetical protein